jgi:transcriptional regulator with XRE-family HTH domain
MSQRLAHNGTVVKPQLTQEWGGTVTTMSGMLESVMGNGLKGARIKSGMTQEQAAAALGLSTGGYIKKEQGSRKLNEEFIRKACAVFGVKPEEILLEINLPQAQSFGPQGEIDPEKLSSFVAQAKDRLSSLSELEAKNLVLALISASRKP